MLHKIAFVVCALFVIVGCKKSDGPSPQEERTSMLLDKKWQLTSMAQDWIGDNGTPVHFEHISLLEEHQRDNYWVYHSDNTFSYHDNAIKGPEGQVDPLFGKWSISVDGKALTIIYDDNPAQVILWEFASLTATEMKLEKVDGIITNTNTYVVVE